MLNFLRKKFETWNLSDFIYTQLESVLQWFLMYLPAIPGMVLRFVGYKLFFKQLTGFLFVEPNVKFVHMNRIRLGKNIAINSGTYINGFGEIDIEDFVLIGSNVTISSGMHPFEGRTPHVIERGCTPKKITIKEGAWLGAGVVIMPGITIGKGCVIGANSVVTKDTPEYSVVAGIPAKKIKDR